MLWLLQMLLWGHIHKWTETDRIPLAGEGFDGRAGRIGTVVYCTCEKCGQPTRFKLR